MLSANRKALDAELKKAYPGFVISIKTFDYGNQFIAMVMESYEDVRLVGAPPAEIGKYGGDLDNWVWPRHTGDFSVFRIYVGPDNKPANYSADNVPYTPIQYLNISFKDRKEGDFTMVYGFPGMTEQHVVSEQLKFIIEKERPARIQMRDESLAAIDKGMKSADLIRIQYAAKQASIANAWKKWIGQVEGINNLDGVNMKKTYEERYKAASLSNPAWKKYGKALDSLNALVKANSAKEFRYAMGIEYFIVGPEYFKLIKATKEFADNIVTGKQKKEIKAKKEDLDQIGRAHV